MPLESPAEVTTDGEVDTFETPSPKQARLDDSFHLETPQRRSCGEWVGGRSLFIRDTLQLDTLFHQINQYSTCSTPNCLGKYKLCGISLKGLGGAVTMTYNCSGCDIRSATFESSVTTELGVPVVKKALQVACVCTGLTFAQYKKLLQNSFGIHAVSSKAFQKTLREMYPIVKGILDEVCIEAKLDMQAMDPSAMGSWGNAVTTGDAVWLTRGFHSRNGTYTVRNFLTGALLYYKHMCQRKLDNVSEGEAFPGTSKSMEGYGADVTFEMAKNEGMNIAVHFQDGDSTSSKSVKKHFPKCDIMSCGSHVAKNHRKHLESLKKRKYFTKQELDEMKKNFPLLHLLAKDAQCCCKVNHHANCGCLSDDFIRKAGSNFFKCLVEAGKDPDKFSSLLTNLGAYHARDKHEWEGGHCDFHPLKVCSCGNCKTEPISCSGRPYKSTCVLSCPYHSYAYEWECLKYASQSQSLIHPAIGRGHSNQVEASHNVLIRFRSKILNLAKLHYEVSTNLGLLQSNLSWIHKKHGLGYHWLPVLFKKMGLPVFSGVEEALKLANTKRMKALEYIKSEEGIKTRKAWKFNRRVREKQQRENWNRKKGGNHDYYGTDDIKPEVHDTCRCGSTSHLKTTHKDCPFNKGTKKLDRKKVEVDDNSASDDYSDIDESSLYESDSDMDIELMYQQCTCPNYPAHLKTCYLSGRNQILPRVLDVELKSFTKHIPIEGVKCDVKNVEVVTNEVEVMATSSIAVVHEKKACKCGSLTHSRTTHKQCPLNKYAMDEVIARDGNKIDMFVVSPPPSEEWRTKAAYIIKKFSCYAPVKKDGLYTCICPVISPNIRISVDSNGNKTFSCDCHTQSDEFASHADVLIKSDNLVEVKCSEISPHIRYSVVGDGNCLFRALSKAITGTEDNHYALRLAIINYMLHLDNVIDFYNKFFKHESNEKMVTLQEAIDAFEKYFLDNNMLEDGS